MLYKFLNILLRNLYLIYLFITNFVLLQYDGFIFELEQIEGANKNYLPLNMFLFMLWNKSLLP